MRRSTRYILLFIIALLAVPIENVFADGWPQKKGEAYVQFSLRAFRSSTYYEPGGNQVDIPTLGDYVASLYGEYGVTDRLTIIGDVPFLERITRNEQVGRETGFVFTEGDAVTGIADVQVGARYGLMDDGKTVVSASLKLGIPVGDSSHPGGLWTGDGEFNQQLALEVGHSFYPTKAYAAALIGFNQRTRGYSDELVYGVESGYTVMQQLTLIGRVRGVEPLRNGRDDVGGQGGFGGNEVRYLSFGAEAAYELTRDTGIRLSVDGATRKQNVLSGVVFGFGVFVKR